jgi:hypothetical protein
VKVHQRLVSLEEAVFEPIGLAKMQRIAGSRQGGNVRRFVRRVDHDEHDVENGLGRQPRHRGGTYVLDRQSVGAQGGPDTPSLIFIVLGPARIGIDKDHSTVHPLTWMEVLSPGGVVHQARKDLTPATRSPSRQRRLTTHGEPRIPTRTRQGRTPDPASPRF